MDEGDRAEEIARERFDEYLDEKFPVTIEGVTLHAAEVLQTMNLGMYERLFYNWWELKYDGE